MTFKSQSTNHLAPMSFKDSKHAKDLEGVLSSARFLHFLERHPLPGFGSGLGAETFSHLLPPHQDPGSEDHMAARICTSLG